MVHFINGLNEVIDDYDVFAFDLWGVIHDGVSLLPGALICLQAIAARGKQFFFVSNSARLSSEVAYRLVEMGLSSSACRNVVTAGDTTRRMVSRCERKELGRKYYMLAPPDTMNPLLGLEGIECVASMSDAHFVLNVGPPDGVNDLTIYAEQLEIAQKLNLPMLCANPDVIVRIGEVDTPCAGAIASQYRDLGGEVILAGKPDRSIYHLCSEIFRISQHSRIVAVGDGFYTDILGATHAGWDSVFILSGIHSKEIGASQETSDQEIKRCALRFFSRYAWTPTWYMKTLAE